MWQVHSGARKILKIQTFRVFLNMHCIITFNKADRVKHAFKTNNKLN